MPYDTIRELTPMGPTALPIWSMPGAQLRSGLEGTSGYRRHYGLAKLGRVGGGRTVERLPLVQGIAARQVRSVV